MRLTFADPRNGFVFRRLFGTNKDLLVALLNALLELDPAHRVVEVELLPANHGLRVDELKFTILKVRCVDARGTRYVAAMQVLDVEGFERHVIYNAAKAYKRQLSAEHPYPELTDVIGISICDFEIWPRKEAGRIPMLSRWQRSEPHGGAPGLGQLKLVFLELPKYRGGDEPRTVVEKWAYFFREAKNLKAVPPVLAEPPLVNALEAARAARFTEAEWDAYLRVEMATQDARRAISLARREGFLQGMIEGLCGAQGIEIDAARRSALDRMTAAQLDALLTRLETEHAWPGPASPHDRDR